MPSLNPKDGNDQAVPITAAGDYPTAEGVLVRINPAQDGYATLDVFGTFGGATVRLQHLPPAIANQPAPGWLDVPGAESITAPGSYNVKLSPRKFRLRVAGGTSVSIGANLNP